LRKALPERTFDGKQEVHVQIFRKFEQCFHTIPSIQAKIKQLESDKADLIAKLTGNTKKNGELKKMSREQKIAMPACPKTGFNQKFASSTNSLNDIAPSWSALARLQDGNIRNAAEFVDRYTEIKKICDLDYEEIAEIYERLANHNYIVPGVNAYDLHCQESIEFLPIPERIISALVNAGITTIRDLQAYNKKDYLRIASLGDGALIKINHALYSKGFCPIHKTKIPLPYKHDRIYHVESVDQSLNDFPFSLFILHGCKSHSISTIKDALLLSADKWNAIFGAKTRSASELQEFLRNIDFPNINFADRVLRTNKYSNGLSRSLVGSGISWTAINALTANNIFALGEVLAHSKAELQNLTGITAELVDEISMAVSGKGWKFPRQSKKTIFEGNIKNVA
jgi:DNA-directed RNA polymerase alpha subunit